MKHLIYTTLLLLALSSQAQDSLRCLPVAFTNVSVNVKQDKATVTWQVENDDVDCKYYDLEKSKDGKDFYPVATIDSRGVRAYSTVVPMYESSFFRVKQVSKTGEVLYSEVFTGKRWQSIQAKAFPNPFTDHISISVYVDEAAPGEIQVFEFGGQKLKVKGVNLTPGLNQITINTDTMHRGTYVIKLYGKNRELLFINSIQK